MDPFRLPPALHARIPSWRQHDNSTAHRPQMPRGHRRHRVEHNRSSRRSISAASQRPARPSSTTTPGFAQATMLKRPGRAEEVAAAILFLASDDASYLLRHRRPAVRGRRYDGAVTNIQPALTVQPRRRAFPPAAGKGHISSSMVGCRTSGYAP
jgi:hypothetical protein